MNAISWMVCCLVFGQCIFIIEANINCYCNTDDCIRNNSSTCSAGYACYAEMFNSSAIYGCIQQVGYSGLCIRQGSRTKEHKTKPYLLTCCYKQLCNIHIQGYKASFLPTIKILAVKDQSRKPGKGVLIPEELVPLGNISIKVLSIIAAGGLFALILIIACAVHILCYDKSTKHDLHVEHFNTMTVLGHSSLV